MTREYTPAPQDDELDLFDFFADDDNADITMTPSERRQLHRRKKSGQSGARVKRIDRPSTKRRRRAQRVRTGGTQTGELPDGVPLPRQPMQRRKRPLGQSILRLAIKIGIIAAAIFVLTQIVGGVFVAHDNNMFPAVRDGDLCITYRLGGYYNGDVVAFERDGNTTFGRVVGIPGDVIDIQEETGFTVNGMTPYEVVYYKTLPQGPAIVYPYVVRDDEIFVLCDQREDAQDSRTFGAVTKPKGKLVLQVRRRGF